MKRKVILILLVLKSILLYSQVDESQNGAWYMYFFNYTFKDSQFGFQGDIQYRDWQGIGDMEQLLLRAGATFKPKNTNVTLTLGVSNITSGVPGESSATSNENRIYQEALLPQKVGGRFLFTHRFRFEQRFVENQDFRTRYRYNLFLNIPINKKELINNAIYAAFYNELFINGQTDIGNNQTVEFFDRNRTYLGIGYVIKPGLRVQLGFMNQKTNQWGKGQLQFSLHHNF